MNFVKQESSALRSPPKDGHSDFRVEWLVASLGPVAKGPVSRLPQGSRRRRTDGKGSRYRRGWGVRINETWELNGFRGLKEPRGVEDAALPVNKFPNAWATCYTPGPWEDRRSKSHHPCPPKTQTLAKGTNDFKQLFDCLKIK